MPDIPAVEGEMKMAPKDQAIPEPEGKDAKSEPERLYAGKYKSTEELEKGYLETQREGLRWRDQAREAEAQMKRIQADSDSVRDTRHQAALTEAEIPLDALDARIDKRALGLLQDALNPLFSAGKAEQTLTVKFPDFPGSAAIQRALDPDLAESYQQLYASNPEAALTMGYRVWQAKEQASHVMSKDEVIKETRRRDATRAPSKGGPSPDEDNDRSGERYEELLNHGLKTGDWNSFLRHRFGDSAWYKRIAQGEDEW